MTNSVSDRMHGALLLSGVEPLQYCSLKPEVRNRVHYRFHYIQITLRRLMDRLFFQDSHYCCPSYTGGWRYRKTT